MNDLSQPAPLFHLVTLSEEVPTTLFGHVTVSELANRVLSNLYAEHDPETDAEGFGHALLCESVRGENGERMTPEFIRSLPNRALPDLKLLMQAAVRVNGMERADVEKE
ncbi:hypothetical protein AWB80_02888 [Caballeronia pedi]|uniref:Uncharacterized protein n=1 Tax=Caballeronia pedi TaxID=1777141 RepID=A0A158B0K6_9BURK|nr:hypothetical protein [Caballeronia pedi]SAK63602.1 hypothetical protein AWB80_02888 [Caballeronia pedi]